MDMLRLCYKQPSGLYETIAETKPNTSILRDGYYLFVIGNENEDEENPQTILCNVNADTGEEIGTFVFNNSNGKYGRLCFFRFTNRALYECSYNYDGEKNNIVACIEYIADDLGLEFISITEMHIALDSNVNRIAKLMRLKRDVVHHDMIVNRKKVEASREKIQGYKEVFQSERVRRVNPTIYIDQKKENAPKLCIYNKTIEIAEESGKDYINEWNDFGKQTIYRSELRLRWESIKEYFTEKGIQGYGIFMAILCPQTLREMFQHFSTRLVYFRNKQTAEVLTIHNIALFHEGESYAFTPIILILKGI